MSLEFTSLVWQHRQLSLSWNFVEGLFFVLISLAACAPVEPTKKPAEGIMDPAAKFYQGKTVRFIVGYLRGGGYDTYTRTIARHIGKYIPGNPSIKVQNMIGRGSLLAANYTYGEAKTDGTTVGVWNSQIILGQALGDRRVKLDARKLGWIGAPAKETPVCAIMGFTGQRTLKDILNAKKPIKMGATRSGRLNDLPKILNKILGTNFEVIPGYRTTRAIHLAMQNREVDGLCQTWEFMRVVARSMLDAKVDNELIPFTIHRRLEDREVKHLPLFSEVIKGKDNLSTYNAWAAAYEFMRPFVAPPGVPKERLRLLRKAFKATLEDPKFLEETKKSGLWIQYVSPEEIEKLVTQVLTISPKAIENLKFL